MARRVSVDLADQGFEPVDDVRKIRAVFPQFIHRESGQLVGQDEPVGGFMNVIVRYAHGIVGRAIPDCRDANVPAAGFGAS